MVHQFMRGFWREDIHLNTSYVMVHLRFRREIDTIADDLNTSYVMVHHHSRILRMAAHYI